MAWIRETLLACVIVTFCAGAAAQYAPPNYLYSSDAYGIHISQVSLNGWSYNMADRATEYSYHAGVSSSYIGMCLLGASLEIAFSATDEIHSNT